MVLKRWSMGAVVAGLALAIGAGAVAQTAPSPARGRLLFLRCASCHEISDRTSLKTGPNLKGVVGRRVASLAGFTYSPALKAQTFVWTPDMLDKWLTKPDALVPGTMMAFEGLPNEADRKALIAYLTNPAP